MDQAFGPPMQLRNPSPFARFGSSTVAAEQDALHAFVNLVADESVRAAGVRRSSPPDRRCRDFAGQYDPMQVSAHKDAVSLFERYGKGGEGPKLKDWAGKTLPALQHHLEMAQGLDKNRK